MKNSNTVLTLVVLLLIAAGAYYLYKNNQPEMVVPTTDEMMVVDESTEPEPAATTEESTTIMLAAIDPLAIDQSGEAVITETATGLSVVLTLDALDATTAQPAHIHMGECPGVGDVAFPLEAVVNGTSTTELDVTMAELKAMLPLAINVHKSATESTVYTACGDVVLP